MNSSTQSSPVSRHPSVLKYAEHINPAFIKLLGMFRYGRVLEKARDVWIWDHDDTRYLDALSSYGAANIGHNHPRLTQRLKDFLDDGILNLVHVGPSTHQGDLAAKLTDLAGEGIDVALMTNSGAEAVEAGMKLARAATQREDFIFCEESYHGTTMGTLSIMGHERMRRQFQPLLGNCHSFVFGDLDGLETLLKTHRTAGVVIDPGLCEAGVLVPPAGFLEGVQKLCRKYGALLILDEVQTGLGRTGKLFAFQHEGFVPDIICLAKSLSGSIVPIGAAMTHKALYQKALNSVESFDVFFSTFGGNSFACAAASETLDILSDENLVENSAALGAFVLESLRSRLSGHPLVREIRGRGLFIAIELGPTDSGWINKLAPALVRGVSKNIFGQWAAVKLLERQVICQPATHNWNILKLMPPLTLQKAEAEMLVDSVVDVLSEYRGVASIVKDATGRLGQQFLSGWAF